MAAERKNTVLVYWGRRGFSQATLDIAKILSQRADLNASLSISEYNELVAEFLALRSHVKTFKTFARGLGALIELPRFVMDAQRLVAEWKAAGVGNVIILMPHVWTPILGYFVRNAGLRYGVVIHDADPHIGDPTAMLNFWIHHDVKRANVIYTLSHVVARKLAMNWNVPADRITTLFLPLLSYSGPQRSAQAHSPLRVLFLGRIMAYKGLPLLVAAIEQLRDEGNLVEVGVAGEGNLDDLSPRLKSLNAEIFNYWLDYKEICEIQSRYDVVAAPYIEASQSGVVMAAFGAGMPVIVTPVGGLVEQVEDGRTGLIAKDVSAGAIANCLRRLYFDPELYRVLVSNIEEQRNRYSVDTFVSLMLASPQVADKKTTE